MGYDKTKSPRKISYLFRSHLKSKSKKEEELEKRLDNTCSNDPPVSQNVTERIKILKEELEKIIEYRTKHFKLKVKEK